jgi:2'-5' RNA ligase
LKTSPQEKSVLSRVFVCVTPPEDVAGEAERFIEKLGMFQGFRWAKRGQLHVTLKFLGEVTPERVVGVDTNLSRIGGLRPFGVTLSGFGAFPGLGKASVLWIGVSRGGEKLTKLASLVGRAASASGCEVERQKFHPHMTIARARGGTPPGALSDELREVLSRMPPLSWTCANFTLMRSVLLPDGAAYSPIGNYPAS